MSARPPDSWQWHADDLPADAIKYRPNHASMRGYTWLCLSNATGFEGSCRAKNTTHTDTRHVLLSNIFFISMNQFPCKCGFLPSTLLSHSVSCTLKSNGQRFCFSAKFDPGGIPSANPNFKNDTIRRRESWRRRWKGG